MRGCREMRAQTDEFRLPTGLAARARLVFGHDLSDVVVRVGGDAEALHCAAVARSDEIHVAPDMVVHGPGRTLRLLGHELAHVVQQREGRVVPTARISGLTVNDDVGLECEADRWAEAFVEGIPLDREPLDVVARPRRVAQRHVSVCGEALFDQDHLPDVVSDVLTLIAGAERWLEWAITDGDNRFDFSCHEALVQGIQLGLHATPLILLRNLEVWASPAKLCSLSAHDLRLILEVEEGNGNARGKRRHERTRCLLLAHDLRDAKQLHEVDVFLQELGVEKNALFSAMPLGDRVSLLALRERLEDLERLSHAEKVAEWAASVSPSPGEFDDVLLFAVFADRAIKKRSKKGRPKGGLDVKDHGELWNALDPIVQHHYSRCPVVDFFANGDDVHQELERWLSLGNMLGFQTTSAGVRAIIEHVDVLGAEDPEGAIRHYMSRVEELVLHHAPRDGHISQDGLRRYLDVESARHGHARLMINGRDCLTLVNARLRP